MDSLKGNATSLDVSLAAGVSRATVSRCFTEGAAVRDSTRARVLSAAEALAYRPNLLARMLNKRESNIVAVITADFQNPFQPALMEALTDGLQAQGLLPLLLKAGHVDEPADMLIELALSYRVSAIIVTVLSASRPIIHRCFESATPLIFLNRVIDDDQAISICSDVHAAASVAADALADGGATRIGVITGRPGTWAHSARRTGFSDRLRALGLPIAASEPGNLTYEGGQRAVAALLQAVPDLDAIYACNDAMALGALDAIRLESGRAVPGDVAVIGFDNVPMADWAAYRLSTLDQPIPALIAATRDVLARPDRGLGLRGTRQLHQCRLIRRATTRAAHGKEP